MYPFRMLEEADLLNRVGRLSLEERDLAERLAKQLSALENADGWYKSDPLYQRLSSVLDGVRRELREAEKELARRANAPAGRGLVSPADETQRASYAQRFRRSLARFARPGKWRGSSDEPAYQM